MKRFIFIVELVLVASLSSCLGIGGSSTSDPSKTKVEIDGRYIEVDTFTANHYFKYVIKDALVREEYVSKVVRPTDASTFGKKRAEVVKRTFRQFQASIEECGPATLVFYDKGIEIIKDEQSWFYDGEHLIENPLHDKYEYGNYPDIHYMQSFAAAESVLHPGLWEPILIEYGINNNWYCKYAYTCGCPEDETFYISQKQQQKLRNSEYNEWIISKKTF